MKANYKIFIAILISFFSFHAYTAFSAPDSSDFIWNIRLDYHSENSSKFFDGKGVSQPRMKEYLAVTNEGGEVIRIDTNQYTLKFGRDVLALNASLVPGEESPWSFYARLEASYNSLLEQYLFDRFSNRKTRADFSFFKADYFALGADYNFADRFSDKFQYGLMTEARTPFGFHDGILDDSTYQFLADGAFEALGGAFLQLYSGKWDWKFSTLYNWRGEDFKDQLLFGFRGRASSVPGTHITLEVNAAKALASIPSDIVFDPRKYPLAEDWLDFGFGFDIGNPEINAGFLYSLRLIGRNAWGKNVIKIWVGAAL
ncbi:MAG: hypothetical protein ACM3U1_02525 [Chloroflexota bacterium]